MKKLRTYFLISVMPILLFSCCTPSPSIIPTLSPIPETVALTEDSQLNELMLIINDLRWRKWSLHVKLVTENISKEDYDLETAKVQAVLDTLNLLD